MNFHDSSEFMQLSITDFSEFSTILPERYFDLFKNCFEFQRLRKFTKCIRACWFRNAPGKKSIYSLLILKPEWLTRRACEFNLNAFSEYSCLKCSIIAESILDMAMVGNRVSCKNFYAIAFSSPKFVGILQLWEMMERTYITYEVNQQCVWIGIHHKFTTVSTTTRQMSCGAGRSMFWSDSSKRSIISIL